MPWLWKPSPQRIVVPAGQTTPISIKKNFVSKAVFFADQKNTVTITIGPNILDVVAGARPNIAQFQLDAGRSAEIFTDNVVDEFFDLHEFWAAHENDDDQVLYVTIWSPGVITPRMLP